MNILNREVIGKLAQAYRDDAYRLKMIYSTMNSFTNYHKAVYSLELYKKLFYSPDGEIDGYTSTVMEMDTSRTRCHNSLLSSVRILNRMAKEAGLEPVYDGEVSEEQPYRRQVADAVFNFMQELIEERS